MKVLFVHQNFPGQFLYLAPELQARGHDVRALTDGNNRRVLDIPSVRYSFTPEPVLPAQTRLGRNFTTHSDRGVHAARAALRMKAEGYVPDVIFGHSGWGETLFLKEVWPEARLIVYAEFYYSGIGQDVGFDLEFGQAGFDQVMIAQSRAAHLAQSLLHADEGVSPTKWQAGTYPRALRRTISVIHDGVDTSVMAPDPEASVTLPNGRVLRAGEEVLTFVNRNLEPYRGYHTFIRALPEVLEARPEAQVVIVGGDEVSYGSAPEEGTWKGKFLSEVEGRIDMSRVHFIGKVPYQTFRSLMQVSRAHAYLTYPFVLSWSMLEAMSAGALVIGSDTPPVREVIRDGKNGLLVDFFDIPGWSRVMTEALADPDKFRPLREAARRRVINAYDLRTVCLPRMVALVEG
ncbi:glycosyltransferase [Falsirhodobacter xinxiangensis]|uniref:glycosyltransferase n=1 Tax=Falsirhodobacter xinxiangensis TaxID=2530049 RepID=UPI0010A9CDDF|nr:glycosyltransferase [Rhodobacter xinxiangensis]